MNRFKVCLADVQSPEGGKSRSNLGVKGQPGDRKDPSSAQERRKRKGGVKLVARLLGLKKDYCTLELMPI